MHPAQPTRNIQEPRPAAEAPVRVLVVSDTPAFRERAQRVLAKAGMRCTTTRSLTGAVDLLAERSKSGLVRTFDVALVDQLLPDGRGLALAATAQARGTHLVLAGEALNADDAVAAIRAGVTDLLVRTATGAEIIERISAAAAKARAARRQRGRIVKLRRMCRRLNTAREQVSQQVDTLCSDLVNAYQELADHMNQVTTATEFKGLIRNELDIESLLRTTLEFVLSRSGPTNAAIFLPTTSGDYSLGAYVNYDCPKETVDVLLDHLANVVAPRFENVTGLVHLTDRKALDRYIGDDAQWLADSSVAAMACRHEGETLAIFLLFRERRNTFNPTLLEQVQTIGELFAAQLARVIHIHHRHLPKDKWGMFGDHGHEHDDGYGDLAA